MIDRSSTLKEYAANPSLAQFKVVSSIADSFAKLSGQSVIPLAQKFKTLLVNKGIAQFEELSSIAESLLLISDRGNFKGDKGDVGETGSQGVVGAEGKDGVDGKNGVDGIAGSAGIDGKNGRDGKDGINGINGRDGKDGSQGSVGIAGTAGKDGSPDTAEQLKEKLKQLEYIDQPTLQYVVDSLWQRTQYLVNKSGNTIVTAAGIYTPTFTSVANLDSITGTSAQYLRAGNTVTVSGRFTANPTDTATQTTFGMSLPIGSNFGNAYELGGVAFSGTITGMGAEINADTTNDRANVTWISSDTASNTWSYTFIYQVI